MDAETAGKAIFNKINLNKSSYSFNIWEKLLQRNFSFRSA
ncbi:hypothetical protein EMIT036CA2_10998 [Chryseobacterium sp. IT-36CA2]